MSRAGVGLSLVEGARGELIVERVNPGGPAALEGSIRPGDQIVGVNGVPAIGMKIKDVAPHITGPPLTLVEIIVLRQGFQIPVRIQRGSTVPPPAAQTQRPPTAGSQYKGSQRLGGESAAGRDPRALAAEAAMKRQVCARCEKAAETDWLGLYRNEGVSTSWSFLIERQAWRRATPVA
eukprot:2127997-Rhodomonas_salina.3